MKFEIMSAVYTYFLIIRKSNIEIIYDDELIAHILNIPLERYQAELANFGGEETDGDTTFYTIEEINQAFQYMDDKYGIILALL